MKKNKAAILVHLKLNSQRLKGKNLKLLNGVPLYEHTFKKLKKNKSFFDVYIHSSSEKIEKISNSYGFEFLKRQKKLDLPNAQGNELIMDCIGKIENEILIQLFVTNPFIKIKTLKNMVRELKTNKNVNSITPITNIYNRFWHKGTEINHKYNKLVGTQFMTPVSVETGVYCFRKKAFNSEKSRICKKNKLLEVDEIQSFDIDTKLDFLIAENLMKTKKII